MNRELHEMQEQAKSLSWGELNRLRESIGEGRPVDLGQKTPAVEYRDPWLGVVRFIAVVTVIAMVLEVRTWFT